jgi:hypothetical protein
MASDTMSGRVPSDVSPTRAPPDSSTTYALHMPATLVCCCPLISSSCDDDTGICSTPTKNNGTPCNDGNPCTESDQCNNGQCGGSPKSCVHVEDQCNDSGYVDTPAPPSQCTCACTHTFTLGFPAMPTLWCSCDASPGRMLHTVGDSCFPIPKSGGDCDDTDACTSHDTCSSGDCSGSPISCDYLEDQCNTASCVLLHIAVCVCVCVCVCLRVSRFAPGIVLRRPCSIPCAPCAGVTR